MGLFRSKCRRRCDQIPTRGLIALREVDSMRAITPAPILTTPYHQGAG